MSSLHRSAAAHGVSRFARPKTCSHAIIRRRGGSELEHSISMPPSTRRHGDSNRSRFNSVADASRPRPAISSSLIVNPDVLRDGSFDHRKVARHDTSSTKPEDTALGGAAVCPVRRAASQRSGKQGQTLPTGSLKEIPIMAVVPTRCSDTCAIAAFFQRI